MLLDYHLHTRFSDGTSEPKHYASQAAALGLDEIGISDHAPMTQVVDDWHMAMGDLESYVQLVEEAQQAVPVVIVRLGLEVDFVPGQEDFIRQLASLYPWDYFLGAVHYIGDFNVDSNADAWRGRDVDRVWQDYFELWTQAARSGLFDIMAHPDLPKKFGFRPKVDLTAVFEQALTAVKKADAAIELSTAGLRKTCAECYPDRPFLQLARRLDIPICLGSDAHAPKEVGLHYKEAVGLARSAGYQQVCRFHRRRRSLVPLG